MFFEFSHILNEYNRVQTLPFIKTNMVETEHVFNVGTDLPNYLKLVLNKALVWNQRMDSSVVYCYFII